MKECALCRTALEAGRPGVELAGGFFDPQDPEFFIIDDSVMVVSYMHLECLLKTLTPHRKGS